MLKASVWIYNQLDRIPTTQVGAFFGSLVIFCLFAGVALAAGGIEDKIADVTEWTSGSLGKAGTLFGVAVGGTKAAVGSRDWVDGVKSAGIGGVICGGGAATVETLLF